MSEKKLPQKLKEMRKVNNYTQDYVAAVLGIVRQIHGPVDIGFDSGLIGSQRKEQFMHAAHMLAGLHRTVQ